MRFTTSSLTLLFAAAASALPIEEAAGNLKTRACCSHTAQIECSMAAAINPGCRNSPACVTAMQINCRK
jgi:hypothetical protein